MPIDLYDILGSTDTRIASFLRPKRLKEMRKHAVEKWKRIYADLKAKGEVEDWDEDKTSWKAQMVIRGETFKAYTLWDIPPAKLSDTSLTNCKKLGKSDFLYWHAKLPAGDPVNIYLRSQRGKLMFTKPVTWPVLSQNKNGELTTWMSLSPMEMMTQRSGVRLATGTVLVGGLGLGWFLQKICKKESVERVIVVDRNQTILDVIGARLQQLFPEVKAKVTDWICDDVYNQIDKHGPDVRHMLDIWDGYGNRDWNYEKLVGKVRHLWGWGFADRAPRRI